MGNYFKKLWLGEDLDKVNPVTGLSKRDLNNLRRSWTIVYNHPDKHGIEIFLRIFRRDPQTKAVFTMIQNMDAQQIPQSAFFRAHVCKVMALLDTALRNLHQPEVVVALMHELGLQHNKLVDIKHFETFKTVFLEYLRDTLQADDALITSWTQFIHFIYEHILEKYGKTEVLHQ